MSGCDETVGTRPSAAPSAAARPGRTARPSVAGRGRAVAQGRRRRGAALDRILAAPDGPAYAARDRASRDGPRTQRRTRPGARALPGICPALSRRPGRGPGAAADRRTAERVGFVRAAAEDGRGEAGAGATRCRGASRNSIRATKAATASSMRAAPTRSRRSIAGSISTNCCRRSTSARRRPTDAPGSSARVSGSYTHDFRPVTLVGSSRSAGDDTARIYQLYLDASDEPSGLSGRIGRQSLFGSGVFGRFDGVRLGWQASPAVELHAQAGFPVYLDPHRPRDPRSPLLRVQRRLCAARRELRADGLLVRPAQPRPRRPPCDRHRRPLYDQGDRAVRAGRCRRRVRQAQPFVPQRDDPDGRRGEPFDPGRPAILSAAVADQRRHRPARPAARGAQAAVRPADARAARRGSLGAQPQPDGDLHQAAVRTLDRAARPDARQHRLARRRRPGSRRFPAAGPKSMPAGSWSATAFSWPATR